MEKSIRNQKSETSLLCACNHKFKLHITGKSETLKRIFPKINYSHICAGILIICLMRKCTKAELILPKTQLNIETYDTPITYQIGFSPVPIWNQTENILWEMGFVTDIIRIDIETQSDCENLWISPNAVVQDEKITFNYMGNCSKTVEMHVRQTSQPDMVKFCTFYFNTGVTMAEALKQCNSKLSPKFKSSVILNKRVYCAEDTNLTHWNFQIPPNALAKRKCGPKFIVVFNDGKNLLSRI